MDEYEGRNGDPLSLHKYLYAHADPVDNCDPTGHFTLQEAAIVGAVVGSLATIGGLLYFKYRTLPVVVSWTWRNTWEEVGGSDFLGEDEMVVLKR